MNGVKELHDGLMKNNCTSKLSLQINYIPITLIIYIITPAIQRSEYLFGICPDLNFEFDEPYFGVAN